MLKLAVRVSRLEQTVETQRALLERVRKQPKTYDGAPTRIVETGIDFDGNPVRIEQRIPRPRGRPSGSRDQVPRTRRWPRKPEGEEDVEDLGGRAASDALLDPDFDLY
jgi:hypothetical protein